MLSEHRRHGRAEHRGFRHRSDHRRRSWMSWMYMGICHSQYHAWRQAVPPKAPFDCLQGHLLRMHRCRRCMRRMLPLVFHTRRAVPDRTLAPDDNSRKAPCFLHPASCAAGCGYNLHSDEADRQAGAFSFYICRCKHRRYRDVWNRRRNHLFPVGLPLVHPAPGAKA